MAKMGAVARLMGIRRRPRYGKRIGNETGYITKVIERTKMTKVTIEKRVIMSMPI